MPSIFSWRTMSIAMIISVLAACGSKESSKENALKSSPSDRQLVFQEAGFRVTLPSSWSKETYRVHEMSASEREEILPGAAHLISLEYQPLGNLSAPQNVLSFIALSEEWRDELGNVDTSSPVAVLGRSSDYVYLLTLPQANPFPDSLEDFRRFNQLLRGLGSVISSFEILDGAIAPTVEELTGAAFSAQLPAADASRRIITLRCSEDAVASIITEFIGKGEQVKEMGEWSAAENVLSFQPLADDSLPKGAPLKWTVKGEFLIPLEWDRNLYGSLGLPLRQLKRPVTVTEE